ncbi:hypothetical protein ACI797_02595 [Geodermatophilus sp. SYSU D00691]
MEPKHGSKPYEKSWKRRAAEWGFTAIAIGPAAMGMAGNVVANTITQTFTAVAEQVHAVPARPPGFSRIITDCGYDYDRKRWAVPHPVELAEKLMQRVIWQSGWHILSTEDLPAGLQHRLLQDIFYAVDANTAMELLRAPSNIVKVDALRPLIDGLKAEQANLSRLDLYKVHAPVEPVGSVRVETPSGPQTLNLTTERKPPIGTAESSPQN